ncbi:MAG: metallophosphoesterase, partial [bacterium]
MLKILHTSDIHIGTPFSWLGDRASDSRKQIKTTFENIVNVAIEKEINVVIITGDIFDSPFPSEINKLFYRDQLFRLSDNGIKTVVLPGNHDRLEDGSIFTHNELYQNDPNIYIFDAEEKRSIPIDELFVTFFANTTLHQKSKISPLKGLKQLIEESGNKYRVCLAHGSVEMGFDKSNYPINKEDIDSLGANYLALGDWHSYLDVSTPKQKAVYAGSPELVEWNQTNSGYIVVIELDEGNIKTERIKVGKRSFESIDIDLETVKSMDDLQKNIKAKAGMDNVLIVNLKGMASFQFDKDELEESLSSSFFYLGINNQAIESVDWKQYENLEEHTVVGEYVRLLKEQIKSNPDDGILKKSLTFHLS